MTIKPDFIVIGAMKSGTTWVDDMLRAATNATLPAGVKETFYLDRHWQRGPEWYAAHWTKTVGPRGEVASTYYAIPECAERAEQATNPDSRFAVLLREPAARSWSHFQHLIRKGLLSPDTTFEAAVASNPELIAWSRYTEVLDPWVSRFGDRLTVLPYEDLRTDPLRVSKALCQALGLELTTDTLPQDVANEARRPRAYWLSKAAGRTSQFLHDSGMHKAVEVAKRLGVARMVEGQAKTESEAQPAAIEFAREALDADKRETARRYPALAQAWSVTLSSPSA